MLLLYPGAVMCARPGKIDLAAAHGVVGALHAEGADVDVTNDDRGQDGAGRCMEKLSPLHAVDVQRPEGKQHDDAAHGQRQSEYDDGPENQLLSGIETQRRRMTAGYESSELTQPAPV